MPRAMIQPNRAMACQFHLLKSFGLSGGFRHRLNYLAMHTRTKIAKGLVTEGAHAKVPNGAMRCCWIYPCGKAFPTAKPDEYAAVPVTSAKKTER